MVPVSFPDNPHSQKNYPPERFFSPKGSKFRFLELIQRGGTKGNIEVFLQITDRAFNDREDRRTI